MKTSSASPHPKLELEDVDPLSSRTFSSFMRTLHLHRQAVMKSLTDSGRGFSHVGCLRVLAAEDGISQRDLAETLHLSRPTITTMLHGMEEEGVIVRRPDEHDRRLTRVHLTDEGRKVERELRAGISDYVNRTVGSLSADERETLDRLLGKLAESIAQTMTDPVAEPIDAVEEDIAMGAAE